MSMLKNEKYQSILKTFWLSKTKRESSPYDITKLIFIPLDSSDLYFKCLKFLNWAAHFYNRTTKFEFK